MYEEGQEVMLEKTRLPVKVVCYGEDFTCVEVESGSKLIVATNRLSERVKITRIGNYDVPEPLKEAPNYSCKVYKVAIDTQELVTELNWEAWMVTTDCSMFSKRLVHLNKEAAKLHAKAFLSFFLSQTELN